MVQPPVVDPRGWEKVYDEQIAPRMDAVIELCRQFGIPCSCVFQLSAGEDPLYCATQIPTNAGERFRRWMVDWQADIDRLRDQAEWRQPPKGDA